MENLHSWHSCPTKPRTIGYSQQDDTVQSRIREKCMNNIKLLLEIWLCDFITKQTKKPSLHKFTR